MRSVVPASPPRDFLFFLFNTSLRYKTTAAFTDLTSSLSVFGTVVHNLHHSGSAIVLGIPSRKSAVAVTYAQRSSKKFLSFLKMSGNLKILVHKSWHVWKRENREKVARDERNFKEENERKDERERNLLQEKNLEELISAQERLPQDSTEIGEPFRLFGDIEELDKKNKELKEQNQARKDKEFNDKKKSGEAPWALGEGAAEKIGSIVPYWYKKPSTNTASSATSSSSSSSSSRNLPFSSDWGGTECEEDAILKREELRKVAQDPMIGILKPLKKKADDSLPSGTGTGVGSDMINLVKIKIEGEKAASVSNIPLSRLSYNSDSSKNERIFHPEEKEKDKEKKSKHKHSRKSEKDDDRKHKKRRKSSKNDSDNDSDSHSNTATAPATATGRRIKTERDSKKEKHSSSRSSAEYDNDRNNSKRSSSIGISNSSHSSADRPIGDRITGQSYHSSISAPPLAPSSSPSSAPLFASLSIPPSTSFPSSTTTTSTTTSTSTSVLRQRRMEREYAERKRATVVLARADIFGPLNALGLSGLPDGREQRYNQQFHPHIAR